MISAARKPTILFVHGSWHTPRHFRRVRDVFETHGYETVCPRLPSIGQPPPSGPNQDGACVRDELRRLIEGEGKEVVVVAHSYGGVAAQQGADAEFMRKLRAGRGLSGGVVHMLYLSGFLLRMGESLASARAEQPMKRILTDGDGMSVVSNPEWSFYNDLPADEQKFWSSELVPCPVSMSTTPVTKAAYAHHPVTYLLCEQDEAISISLQQRMVQRANDAAGISIRTVRCSSGHSPYLSMPEIVLGVVDQLV